MRVYICVYYVYEGGMGAMSDLWEKSEEPRHYLSTCEIFDPATNMWIMGPNLPRGMCGMGVVKYYGTIYLLGKYLFLHISMVLIQLYV